MGIVPSQISAYLFACLLYSEMSGLAWITQERLELGLVEKIMPREYENFVKAMDRLVAHPYSYKAKDFIEKYRKPLLQQLSSQLEIPQVQYDEKGRSFITTYGE